MLGGTCRTKRERVSAIDQSLFVAASRGRFSWETENAIRGEERRGEGRGIIKIKRVSEVWRGDGASVVGGPVGVADPLRRSSSSEAVAGTRLHARAIANDELDRCGLPPRG